MEDNLRDPDNDRQAFEEALGLGSVPPITKGESPRKAAPAGLFGMSAVQRLIIAALLFVAVCVLGTMCLLITGRIGAF